MKEGNVLKFKRFDLLILFSLGMMLVTWGIVEKVEVDKQTSEQLDQKSALYDQAKKQIKYDKPSVNHKRRDNSPKPKYDAETIHDFDYNDYKAAISNNVISKYAVATIEIPSVGIREPILEGVSNQNLSVGVVTVKPNEKPGTGNYALAGHNQLSSGQLLFGNLAKVQIGNEIKISTKSQEYTYQITEINENLSADHGEIISDSQGDKIITLYTCNNQYNFGRIYVRGKLI